MPELNGIELIIKVNEIKPSIKALTINDCEYVHKRTGTGSCVMCENFAAYIATYDVGGATRIERYCERCIKSVQ